MIQKWSVRKNVEMGLCRYVGIILFLGTRNRANLLFEPLAKVPLFVTPVKTGVQNPLNSLDTGFRRYDGIGNM
jgi:hypothetical protein